MPIGAEAAYTTTDTWKDFQISTTQTVFQFTPSGGEATLTGYTDQGAVSVTIPGEVFIAGTTYPVTVIDDGVFQSKT
jgi:hypothetical protein